MELVPLGPGFGVEVRGITMLDVASDADAYKAVRSAFEEHSLLVFRDQTIADDIQAVAQHPDQYELDIETHLALLSAAETLQQLLARLTHVPT